MPRANGKLIYVRQFYMGIWGKIFSFITLFPKNSVLENNQLEEEGHLWQM